MADGWGEAGRGEDERRAHTLPHTPDEAEALVHAFTAWAADQRAGEAAASRSRERWLRQQVAEGATLVGTLVDLAERGADVTLVVGAHTVTGWLVGVGEDGCVVADRRGGVTIVAVTHLTAVRVGGTRPGRGEASGDRSPAGPWTVRDALEALAAERSSVRLGTTTGDTSADIFRGDLISVGEDVLTLRARAGSWTHVALSAVETCAPA